MKYIKQIIFTIKLIIFSAEMQKLQILCKFYTIHIISFKILYNIYEKMKLIVEQLFRNISF